MSMAHWPQHLQPREKLLAQGADSLSDAELLAILLRHGSKGKSALQMAQDLLEQFGGLRPLLHAEQQQLCRQPGIGPCKYAEIQAMLTLMKRQLQQQLTLGPSISDPAQAKQLLLSHLRDLEHERFCVLWLNKQHQLLRFEPLFFGTIDGASVYPRVVVTRALQMRAAACILAHNHPSGISEPSQADEQITYRLRDALALIDVRVLDHLVVGDGVVTSLAQRGLL